MEKLLGKIIEARGSKYKVMGFKEIEPKCRNIIKACENSGKYPAYFFCYKILRSGKVSNKQNIVCFFFKKSEHFVIL